MVFVTVAVLAKVDLDFVRKQKVIPVRNTDGWLIQEAKQVRELIRGAKVELRSLLMHN